MYKKILLNFILLAVVMSALILFYLKGESEKVSFKNQLNIIKEQQNVFQNNFNRYKEESQDKIDDLIGILKEQDSDFSLKVSTLKKEQEEISRLNIKNNNLFKDNLINIDNKVADSISRRQNIVSKWSKVVVRLECKNKGKSIGNGSGVFFGKKISNMLSDQSNIILTNDHVIKEGDVYADSCKASFLNDNNSRELKEEKNNIYKVIDEELDATYLYFNSIPSIDENYDVCTKKLQRGEEVLILGYPSIGSDEDITITSGIIAGYDEEFYMTDAKIAKGNSGGAAISVKHDCYFGIPTLVMKGKIESMGRVLDIKNILK